MFTNPNFSEEFFKQLRSYFISQKFTDITLKCDNIDIKCHKIVLASFSPYFSAMFSHNFSESQTNQVDMSMCGQSANHLMDIIDYAYCGSINLTLTNVKDILLLSSLLQINDLIQATSEFWFKNINDFNCLDIFLTSSVYNLNSLFIKSKEYIFKYFNRIYMNEYFLQCDFDILNEILSSDELNITNEEVVLIAVIKWISFDYENRSDLIENCLNLVRFSLIDPKVLTANELVNKYEMDSQLIEGITPIICDLVKKSICQKAIKRAGMVTADECFIIIGGNRDLDDVDSNYTNCINPKTLEKSFISINHSDKSKNTRYLSHIENPGVCVTQSNRIFMAGGKHVLAQSIENEDLTQNRFYLSKELYEYDPVYDTWIRRSNMLFAKSNFSMCALDNRIYTFGGITIDEDRIDIVEYYDIDESKWTYVGSMPTAFISGQVVSYNGIFYVMGGRAGVGRLNSCFTFDPIEKEWNQVSSMRIGRFNFGACVVGNRIYVIGGQRFIESDNESLFTRIALNSVEIYDIINDQWSIGPSVPQPIYNTSFLLSNNNQLFVFGTTECRTRESNMFGFIFTSLFKFDLSLDEWSLVENDITDVKSNYQCVSAKINTRKLHKYVPKTNLL